MLADDDDTAATRSSTPRHDGFRMPAEWEEHAGTWLAWPERTDNWRLGAKPAQAAFAEVATALTGHEQVTIAVSEREYEHCRSSVPPAVRLVEMATDDAWMRDTGPTFVVSRDTLQRRGVDWVFNAWGGLRGGLYSSWERDDRVARQVLDVEGSDRYRAPLVLEGGSIDVDGQGTCLTTEQCLLNPNRNPDRSARDIEAHLHDYLRVDKVLWLGDGVFGDETDGHVDNLARFVAPGHVALTWTEDANDPQHAISRDARRRLEGMTDARGRALEVHLVPSPGPLRITEAEARGIDSVPGTLPRRAGDRLAGSYVNFYVANRVVLLPLLDARRDDQATEVVGTLFSDRAVVPIAAREILLGGGNVHCITQQVPAV